ncbi:hypothetical protein L3Q82_021258 [Scortum barcoo]|uniref:Uncharacterized protein n=1 Tax=Scortum barcoo TaxID=214431 RepID=A0ACB8X3J7_9TELE|nr:hypothetical protein L3Q82_021258 [Scortum barcoo]
MVVGTGQGMLHFINTQTRQEVKSLVSSCDGISSCVFLKDGRLATTSFDGRIETWDIENGCRTALIDAHTNAITASDITADRKHLATVSLDFMMKVWSSAKGHMVAALPSSSPLNCVTFDPEGHLLAAGCWNGKVVVWNWLQNKTLASLSGHQRSVRSLSSLSLLLHAVLWLCVRRGPGVVSAHLLLCGMFSGSLWSHSGPHLPGGRSHAAERRLRSHAISHVTVCCEQEPPLKKLRSAAFEPAALCVAVNGDYAAVGYHGDGIKLFTLDQGEKIWADLDVSVLCLLWVVLDPEQTEPELLVSAGKDKHLKSWKREEGEVGMLGGLKMQGLFGVQSGAILALAQNSTYLASASDDCTVVLWLLSELAVETSIEPHDCLRGHNGGVTCLAFSPDGGQLLSGGKDQLNCFICIALMLWDVSVSPAVLSKSLPHSHRDWITDCVWTADCVISSSNDGRLCFWDLQAGQCVKEISWKSPLTSICCLMGRSELSRSLEGPYVMAGCAEGSLHVWNWKTNIEISHIAAHKERIHHCSLLPDKKTEVNPEEMTVITASDDGTVQLWKPLQVEHFSTFQGHSGGINKVVRKDGLKEILTISEDFSLRCWTVTTETPPSLKGPVTALCFSQRDDLLLAGYESGLLEIWQHSVLVGHKQTSDKSITAICCMPDEQFAIANMKCVVDICKLVWNQQHNTASLVKVTTYKVRYPVVHLMYCSTLLGVSNCSRIFDVPRAFDEECWYSTVTSWHQTVRVFGLIRNEEKSLWLVGESQGAISIGFMFAMGPKSDFTSAFSTMNLKTDEEEKNGSKMTAATLDGQFVVCGDVKGNMWFIQPPEPSSWKNRKAAHSDRISVLRLTERTIISASYDRTVKLWDRNTKKQERYDHLDLDLECDDGGGGVSHKALFGGMFKRSSKSVQAQDSLSANSELSKSNDSLTDNSTKEKGGVFRGMFKKTIKAAKDGQPQVYEMFLNLLQDSLSLQSSEMSGSSDSLTDNKPSKEKSGVLGGILKQPPKDLLDSELTASNDSLSDKTATKESGGMFSGVFKKSTKPFGARAQSQEDLSAPSELSGSSDNLSVNSNTKDDLFIPGELSGSNDNLSENNNTKEKGGIFSGVFRKKGAKSQSQDDLPADGVSASSDSLTEKSSKGEAAVKFLKNPLTSSSQEKEKTEHLGDSSDNTSTTEKPKSKQEKNSDSDSEEMLDNVEGQTGHKQHKLAEAMTKPTPFQSANKHEKQAGSDDEDPPASGEKSSGNKQVKSNMIQRESKERSETPPVPPRPTEEEMKGTSTYSKVKPRRAEDNQDKKDKKAKPAETPVVPSRPSEEETDLVSFQEMNRAARRGLQKEKSHHQAQSDDEGLNKDEAAEAKEGDEAKQQKGKTTKVKKHKHNPFMPHAGAKAPSDDEGLKDKDDSSSKEEKKEEASKEKTETKVKRPKKHNPFMPRVKGRVVQRHPQDGAADNTENEGGNRSLFDQLEDFCIDPAQPEDEEDLDLMEWWNTVESWEDTPQDDDMTEKEEAKAFAVTAEKVQKGIRVFNKLFSERAESLWQHVIDLNSIADGLDKFSKNTKIAQITGGSTSAIGGVATIAGLALAPFTMGTSLIVTAVGLGVATAGGLTSAGAGISNQVNNSMDRKKVEKIVQDYQEKMVDLNNCLKFIKQGIENLKKFDLIKMKKHAYNRDFPIANMAGSTAARAVQIASMATGVLTGLFVGMDIYFVAKDSKELKKGAKSEFAAKIREVATQLHDGLVELNGIREELQSTARENNSGKETAEDETDRIKKAIKKDIESREYV